MLLCVREHGRKNKDGSAEEAGRGVEEDGGEDSGDCGETAASQGGEKNDGRGPEGDAGGLHQVDSVIEGDDGGVEGGHHCHLDRGIIYSPLATQKRFHDSKARFKGFSGPIGSGKSQALCQEAIKLSYLNSGRTGLLGAPTYATPLPPSMRRSIRMGN